jgi:hypothetical protein
MKTLTPYILFIVAAIASLGADAKSNRDYRIKCVKIETTGYVTFNVWDIRLLHKYSAKQAGKDAIHALLYSGIAGGEACVSQPAYLNNEASIKKFKKVEKQFFSKNGDWLRFVRSSETTQGSTVPTALENKTFMISIAKNDLRRYLESQNIINKMTHGF